MAAHQDASQDEKTLLLLKPRGFCAGVVRAIDIVRIALEAFGPPIYVRKEIVHNRFVVEELQGKPMRLAPGEWAYCTPAEAVQRHSGPHSPLQREKQPHPSAVVL